MAVKRHFFPNSEDYSIPWKAVHPGKHDAFRDYSLGGLGRLVMTECDIADNGAVITLFTTETKVIPPTKHLAIPIIEVAEGEARFILYEGDEYELPIKAKDYGAGTVLFRHVPSSNYPQLS